MKAIIIEESRFASFLKYMKVLIEHRLLKATTPEQKNAINEIHALWHYQFSLWARKEGASLIQ